MKENRRETRFEVSLTARWQGSPSNREVRISDLSRGGCYLDTIADEAVGEVLFLKILLTDGNWLELEGVVAHHTPRLGFGIRFVNLDQKQKQQICTLLGLSELSSTGPKKSSNDHENLVPSELVDLTSRTIM